MKVLVDAADAMAEGSRQRKEYRRVAEHLRWMQGFPGGREKATELAAEYWIGYRQRRAMMEELEEF